MSTGRLAPRPNPPTTTGSLGASNVRPACRPGPPTTTRSFGASDVRPGSRPIPTDNHRVLRLQRSRGAAARSAVRTAALVCAAQRNDHANGGLVDALDRGSAQVLRHRRAGLREPLHGIGLDVLDRELQHVVTCIACLGDELFEEVLRAAGDLALALGARPVPDTPTRRLAVRDLLSRIRVRTEVFDRRIRLRHARLARQPHGPTLLQGMCELVRDQASATVDLRCVVTCAEDYVAADRERPCVHRARELVRMCVGMNAHGTQICAETRLHERSDLWSHRTPASVEGSNGFFERGIEDWQGARRIGSALYRGRLCRRGAGALPAATLGMRIT